MWHADELGEVDGAFGGLGIEARGDVAGMDEGRGGQFGGGVCAFW